MKHFSEMEAACRVSHERFDEALHTLGLSSYKVSLTQLQDQYLGMLEMISDGKNAELKDKQLLDDDR